MTLTLEHALVKVNWRAKSKMTELNSRQRFSEHTHRDTGLVAVLVALQWSVLNSS